MANPYVNIQNNTYFTLEPDFSTFIADQFTLRLFGVGSIFYFSNFKLMLNFQIKIVKGSFFFAMQYQIFPPVLANSILKQNYFFLIKSFESFSSWWFCKKNMDENISGNLLFLNQLNPIQLNKNEDIINREKIFLRNKKM